MEVIQAIRKLLFLEDCVIIPGLGGFVSRYRPALIDKATGTFIPPAKEILFNPELVQNDGVMVAFLAGKNEISMDSARLQVDRFVKETREKLKRNDPVFIDGIGEFLMDKGHKIRFQADAGSNLFLESFGLSSFHLREVFHEEPSRAVALQVSDMKRNFGNRNLRRIAIAMPLLIAFSLLPYNSRIGENLRSTPASMIPEPSLFRLDYPDTHSVDTARTIVFPIAATPDSLATADVKSEEVKAAPGKFPVIAGCFKIKGNADRLHKQLVEKGYPAQITTSRNGQLYKVCVESFATRQEALSGLARLKSAEPGLELWVAW